VRAAGVRLLEADELAGIAAAAATLVGGAERLGYDTVKLKYFGYRPLRAQAG
jgi:hypothetical protein